MNIAVVALGKIGLPLAVQFASKGHKVIGCDVNEKTVKEVNAAIEPFPGEKDLQKKLRSAIESGNLIATLDTAAAVSKCEVVVVVVPLFVDQNGTPDFAWMDTATEQIGRGLKPGTLVSYETTLPVGTTRNRFAKMLEKESGLIAGIDFYLSFSPERVFTGRIFEDLRKYPKLVGGINKLSGTKAQNFYESVLDFDPRDDLNRPNGVWDLGSAEASELAKLAETTYRDVNIGLANQFAIFADKNSLDVYSVIEACNSQPFSHIHQPGIAVGGHCIPIYPQMYLWNDPAATIVKSARTANSTMPAYAVEEISKFFASLQGLSILILGVAYRGGVKETAFSGAFSLNEELNVRGSVVYAHDPLYTPEELINLGFKPYVQGQHVGVIVLQANHTEYLDLNSSDFPGLKLVYDGRNFLSSSKFPGVELCQIGHGQGENLSNK